MPRLIPSLVAVALAVFVLLGVSVPRAEAQIDFAAKTCHVTVAGYYYPTVYHSVDPITPCETYVQGLVDWGCPQLGNTDEFTMISHVVALSRLFPPQNWYWTTNYQCVDGRAEFRGRTNVVFWYY